MNIPDVLTFLVLHWHYFAPVVLAWVSTLHTRLQRWPVFAALVKHSAGLPMLRWVAVDIARAVVAAWGEETPELPAQASLAEDKVLSSLSAHLTPEEHAVLSAALAGPIIPEVHTNPEVPAPPKPHPDAKWDAVKGWVNSPGT